MFRGFSRKDRETYFRVSRESGFSIFSFLELFGSISRKDREKIEKSFFPVKENGKRVANKGEWESALRSGFTTLGLSGFLLQSSSIQVPDDQFLELMVKQMVEQRVSTMQASVVKREGGANAVDKDRIALITENCRPIAEEQLKAMLDASKIGKKETLLDAATAVDKNTHAQPGGHHRDYPL